MAKGSSDPLMGPLTNLAGVVMTTPPDWYRLPTSYIGSDYLLRIEQLLTIVCDNLDFLEVGGLYGEREMLDGLLPEADIVFLDEVFLGLTAILNTLIFSMNRSFRRYRINQTQA